MAQVVLIAHLPLMRMERKEDFPIGGGVLTKLPWEQFDGLSQGAFSDWRSSYELTDPVFFWHQDDLDLPFVQRGSSAKGMAEMKVPIAAWNGLLPQLGLGLVLGFHERLVDPVWAALGLAAPAGILPAPRSSFTFFLPAGETHFEIGELNVNGVRIQGDADLELAYLADGAGVPLSDADLQRAASFVDLARFAFDNTVAGPALRQLLTCGDITLAAFERMLLAVAAIEQLLLPDAKVASGGTFAKRLANLLGRDEVDRSTLHRLARHVYVQRTAVLHSEVLADAELELPPAAAEQLLARVVEAVTTAIASGTAVEQLRRELDTTCLFVGPNDSLPLLRAPGLSAKYRLGPRPPCSKVGDSMGRSFDDTIVSWSPLVGLTHPGESLAHEELGVTLVTMSAQDVVGLEDRDVKRDFIGKVQSGEPVAALSAEAATEGFQVDEAHVTPLTRRRDLAVVGLRLAGFRLFADPEFLGWYLQAGLFRYRHATVLRQSIIGNIESQKDREVVLPEQRRDLEHLWSLLAKYEHHARHAEVDRILDLFRRTYHRRFLPPITRALLAATSVEAMLGRFRPATATRSLERLVRALDEVPVESANWFETSGRTFRNALAHGEWTPDPIEPTETWKTDHEPVAHLVAVARAGVRRMLRIWVDAPPAVRARYGPARLLVRTLGKQAA